MPLIEESIGITTNNLTVCEENVLIGFSRPILQTEIVLSVEQAANVELVCQSTSTTGPITKNFLVIDFYVALAKTFMTFWYICKRPGVFLSHGYTCNFLLEIATRKSSTKSMFCDCISQGH